MVSVTLLRESYKEHAAQHPIPFTTMKFNLPKHQANINRLLLGLIVIVGAVLRFYHYADWSLWNDELSALARLRFTNFNDLIAKGVKPDGHPPGIQVMLYYWTQLFGISEASVRFPFVLSGVLSIPVAYLLGKRWFNTTVGLLVAVLIAVLEYPLLYSRIARMYSTGLFFTLSMLLCWTYVLFDFLKPSTNFKPKYGYLLGYVFWSSCCMYNHYFSFLFALIVGGTGLFLLSKNNVKPYLLALIAIGILYLPNLGIFFHQLGVGGVGGWLHQPNFTFFIHYFSYCFNESYLVFGAVMGILLLGFYGQFSQKNILKPAESKAKFRVLALVFFMSPMVVGYVYSVQFSPILQHSVLLFSLPLGWLLLLSFVPNFPYKIKSALVLSLLFIGTYSTVSQRQFYQTQHFSNFKGIAQQALNYTNKYGDEETTKIINLSNPYYMEYYFNRLNLEGEKHAQNITYEAVNLKKKKGIQQLQKIVAQSKTPYFMFAWANTRTALELIELVQEKYPYLIEKGNYFNSEIYLFAKTVPIRQNNLWQKNTRFTSQYKVEGKAPANWQPKLATHQSEQYFSAPNAAKLTAQKAYSPAFKIPLSKLINNRYEIINVEVMAYLTKINAKAFITFSYDKNGKNLWWHSSVLGDFIEEENTWQKAYLTRRVPRKIDLNDPEIMLSIYVWNKDGATMYVDDIKLEVRQGNPIIY